MEETYCHDFVIDETKKYTESEFLNMVKPEVFNTTFVLFPNQDLSIFMYIKVYNN